MDPFRSDSFSSQTSHHNTTTTSATTTTFFGRSMSFTPPHSHNHPQRRLRSPTRSSSQDRSDDANHHHVVDDDADVIEQQHQQPHLHPCGTAHRHRCEEVGADRLLVVPQSGDRHHASQQGPASSSWQRSSQDWTLTTFSVLQHLCSGCQSNDGDGVDVVDVRGDAGPFSRTYDDATRKRGSHSHGRMLSIPRCAVAEFATKMDWPRCGGSFYCDDDGGSDAAGSCGGHSFGDEILLKIGEGCVGAGGGGSRAPQEAAAIAAAITALTSGHGFLVMMWLCTGGQLRHFVQERSDGDDSRSNNGVLLYEEFEANVYVHCPGARSLGEAVDVVMSAVKGSFHLHREEQRRLQQKQQCVSSSVSSSTAADETATTAYPQQQHQEIIRALSEDTGAPPPPLSLSFHMFAFELLGAVEHQFVARTPMSRRHHHNAAATAAHPPPTSPPHSGGLSSIDEMIARLARECDEKRGGAALHSNTNYNNSHNDNSGGRHDNEGDHHHSPQSAELHKTTQGSNVGNTTTATTVTTVLCGIFRNAREVGALRVLQLTLGSSSSQIVPHLVSFMQYRSIQLGSNGGAGGALPSSNLLHYRGASSSNGRLTTTTATTTRTISKDFWYMIYLFCASDVQYPLFEGYRDTDSWPSLLDQFVDWSRRSVVVRW